MNIKLILLLLSITWGLSFWEMPPFDPDLGWHLYGGAWILEHDAVPRQDVINAFNTQWHDYHWLAQVIFYKLFSIGGFGALRIGLALLMASLFVVLLRTSLKETDDTIWATLVTIGSFYLVTEITQVRPQMIALFLLVLVQGALRSSVVQWKFTLAFLATVILANMHVYWLFIPVLWGCYVCIPRILKHNNARSSVYAWGGLIFLLLSALISPYGIFGPEPLQNYFLIFEYLQIPQVLKDTVLEFRSALAIENFRSVLLLVYVAIIARAFSVKLAKENIADFAVVIITLILTIGGAKYIGLFAVLTIPYLCKCNILSVKLPRYVLFLLLLAGTLYTAKTALTKSPWLFNNTQYIDDLEPFSICQKMAALEVQRNPEHQHIRVLTHFNHGGWCKFGLFIADPNNDYRVTTDNRTQGVPEYHYQNSFDLYGIHDKWLDTLNYWKPELVLVWKNFSLASVLALSPDDWEKVLEDNWFAVFRKKTRK